MSLTQLAVVVIGAYIAIASQTAVGTTVQLIVGIAAVALVLVEALR